MSSVAQPAEAALIHDALDCFSLAYRFLPDSEELPSASVDPSDHKIAINRKDPFRNQVEERILVPVFCPFHCRSSCCLLLRPPTLPICARRKYCYPFSYCFSIKSRPFLSKRRCLTHRPSARKAQKSSHAVPDALTRDEKKTLSTFSWGTIISISFFSSHHKRQTIENARGPKTAGALSGMYMTHLERIYASFLPPAAMIQKTTSAATATTYQMTWLPPKKSII